MERRKIMKGKSNTKATMIIKKKRYKEEL